MKLLHRVRQAYRTLEIVTVKTRIQFPEFFEHHGYEGALEMDQEDVITVLNEREPEDS